MENLPAQRHSKTSLAAARAAASGASVMREGMYLWLLARGSEGATDEEIQLGMPMAANTQRPRRTELVSSGRVVNSGWTRRTRSGRLAVVWKAVVDGK
jgi:hypothetical protein